MLAVIALNSSTALAGKGKFDVCNITGVYDFGDGPVPTGHVITVGARGCDIHFAHGDPEDWISVVLDDGSEVCTLRLDAELLARSALGMETYRFNSDSSSWELLAANDPPWSTGSGWEYESHYSTVQTGDVDGDG